MGRFVTPILFTISILTLGCQSTSRMGSLAWLGGFGGEKKKTVDDGPFKNPTDNKHSNDPGDTTTVAHDAETLKLIRDELRDDTPADRATMVSYLKGQSPATVKMILRQHRLARNLRDDKGTDRFGSRQEFANGIGGHSPNPGENMGRKSVSSDNFAQQNRAPQNSTMNASFGGHSNSFEREPANKNNSMGVNPWPGERSQNSGTRNEFGRSNFQPNRNDNSNNTIRRISDGTSDYRGSGYPNSRPFTDPRGNSSTNSPGGLNQGSPMDNLRSGPMITPGGSSNLRSPLNDLPGSQGFNHRGMNPNDRFNGTSSSTSAGARGLRPILNGDNTGRALLNDQTGQTSFGGQPSRGGVRPSGPKFGPQKPISPLGANTNLATNGIGRSSTYKLQPMPRVWEESLQRLIASTDSLASNTQPGRTPEEKYSYLRNQVFLRMLFLMSDRPHQSMQAIEGIDKSEQEFWKDTFFALTNYFEPEFMRNSPVRAKQTAARLDIAVQHLREKADLEIQQLAFCSEIKSYGNYNPFPKNEFREGDPVLIYTEVANFKSVSVESGMFQTRLRSKMELFKFGIDGQRQVKVYKFQPTVDLCRNRRRDYFLSYAIEIPKQIGIGRYTLQLTVTDEHGNKVATDSINFSIKS